MSQFPALSRASFWSLLALKRTQIPCQNRLGKWRALWHSIYASILVDPFPFVRIPSFGQISDFLANLAKINAEWNEFHPNGAPFCLHAPFEYYLFFPTK
jgi:hypothetical protein